MAIFPQLGGAGFGAPAVDASLEVALKLQSDLRGSLHRGRSEASATQLGENGRPQRFRASLTKVAKMAAGWGILRLPVSFSPIGMY